jgi:hypothetical protein
VLRLGADINARNNKVQPARPRVPVSA